MDGHFIDGHFIDGHFIGGHFIDGHFLIGQRAQKLEVYCRYRHRLTLQHYSKGTFKHLKTLSIFAKKYVLSKSQANRSLQMLAKIFYFSLFQIYKMVPSL